MSRLLGLPERGLKPAAQLAARHPHGHRTRYLGGCRCDACRAANASYQQSRIAAQRRGEANPIVSAGVARTHLLALAGRGVGRRSIASAADVPLSTVAAVITGEKRQIRRATERRLLAVTVAAAADRALIDATPTWRLVERLLEAGFSKRDISREIGQGGKALQLGREQVTVRNAWEMSRAFERLMTSGRQKLDAAPARQQIAELREEGFTDKALEREIGADWRQLATAERLTAADLQRVADVHRRLTS